MCMSLPCIVEETEMESTKYLYCFIIADESVIIDKNEVLPRALLHWDRAAGQGRGITFDLWFINQLFIRVCNSTTEAW